MTVPSKAAGGSTPCLRPTTKPSSSSSGGLLSRVGLSQPSLTVSGRARVSYPARSAFAADQRVVGGTGGGSAVPASYPQGGTFAGSRLGREVSQFVGVGCFSVRSLNVLLHPLQCHPVPTETSRPHQPDGPPSRSTRHLVRRSTRFGIPHHAAEGRLPPTRYRNTVGEGHASPRFLHHRSQFHRMPRKVPMGQDVAHGAGSGEGVGTIRRGGIE